MDKKKLFIVLTSLLMLYPTVTNLNYKANEQSNDSKKLERFIIQFDEKQRETVRNKLNHLQDTSIKFEYSELISGFSIESKLDASQIKREISEITEIELAKRIKKNMYNVPNVIKQIKENKKYDFDGRGMVIALIDSGIDVTHKDMRLDEGVVPKIKNKKESVSGVYTDKIPYGFNYIANNDNLKDKTSRPHGMHIAGILAGNAKDEEVTNKTGIDGIAPNAQLLVYKVFSDFDENYRAETEDIAYAAVEDAIKNEADVISLSVGFYDNGLPGNAYAKIVEKAAEKGVIVTAAIGNAGAMSTTTTFDKVTNDHLGMIDTATTVGVAASPHTIGVGSTTNTHLTVKTQTINNEKFHYLPIGKSVVVNGTYETYYLEIEKLDKIKKEEVEGKVIVYKRNDSKLYDVTKLSKDYNAKGVILINDNETQNRDYYLEYPESFIKRDLLTHSDVWGMSISGKEGAKLLELIKTNKSITLTGSNSYIEYPIESTPRISGFSSWGGTVDLSLKPEIVAPGENVFSTFNDGQYGMMSGTSMASPVVAGSSVILLSRIKQLGKINNFTNVELSKILMMNTAQPLMDLIDEKLEYSPRQQGAGLLNLDHALKNDVLLYHNNKGGVELKEIKENSKTFEITLQNLSNEHRSYDIKNGNVLTSTTKPTEKQNKDGKETVNEVHSSIVKGASIKVDNRVELEPKQTKTIKVELNIGEARDQFVEGYIYFEPKHENGLKLSIPYFGFAGNWMKEKIIDAPMWQEDSKLKITALMTKTRMFNDTTNYVLLGKENYDDKNSKILPNEVAISNQNQGLFTEAYLRFAPLRDLVHFEIDVVDKEDPNAIPLRRIATETRFSRIRYGDMMEDEEYKRAVETAFGHYNWDGKVYNATKQDFEPVKEGQYYYRIKVTNRLDRSEYQYTYLPLKIDNTKPTMTVDAKNKGNIKVTATDNHRVLKVLAYMNDELVPVKKVSESTYEINNVSGKNEKDNILTIQAVDIAGNYQEEKIQIQESHIVYEDLNKLLRGSGDELNFKLGKHIKNIEVTLDGQKREVVDNKRINLYDVEKGPHTLILKLTDKENQPVYTREIKFIKDARKDKIPITITNPKDYDEEGEILKPNEKGALIITGNVEFKDEDRDVKIRYYNVDDLRKYDKGKIKYNYAEVDDKGNFEVKVYKSDYPNIVMLEAFDEKGRVSDSKRFYLSQESHDLTFKDEDEDSHIILEGKFKKVIHLYGESLKKEPNFEKVEDGYTFNLTFLEVKEDVYLKINDSDEKIPMKEDESIKHKIKLKDGFNIVDIKMYRENDNKLIDVKKLFFYIDVENPQFTLYNKVIKNESYDLENPESYFGTIYANKDGELHLHGNVKDNGIFWSLEVNKNLADKGGVWREYGLNEKNFYYPIVVEEGGFVNLEVIDFSHNIVKQKYKVVHDKLLPTIESNISEKTYKDKFKPSFEIKDNLGIERIIYTLDGNVVEQLDEITSPAITQSTESNGRIALPGSRSYVYRNTKAVVTNNESEPQNTESNGHTALSGSRSYVYRNTRIVDTNNESESQSESKQKSEEKKEEKIISEKKEAIKKEEKKTQIDVKQNKQDMNWIWVPIVVLVGGILLFLYKKTKK